MFEDDKVSCLRYKGSGFESSLKQTFFMLGDVTFRLTHARNVTTTRKVTLVTGNAEVVTSKVSNVHLILDQVAMLLPIGIKSGLFSN